MDTAVSCLSKDVETEGFNLESGETWIYPTNMPVRDYQYNIVKEAIYKNTMVVLPTGLGKTFIAAVVMYNFFRWYPNGKIIFMAPTKPLVKQQIDACYNIMAIPKEATVELTGSTGQSARDELWSEKRVFFITPQVLQNDFERITQISGQIKCLVFDEAHRARGNHAYCEVIKQISTHSQYFRVLALSASPGSTVSDVVKVCKSLLISHLEMRTETCIDVARFVFKRTTETVVVKIDGILLEERGEYIKILDYYVRILVKYRVVTGNCANLSRGWLAHILKDYKEANKINRDAHYNEVMLILNQCIVLYHAFELLTKHGLRVFHTFLQENAHKPMLKKDQGIQEMKDRIGEYLGPAPNTDKLPDGSIPDIPKDTKFGHPKFYKLSEIVVAHFKAKGDDSRVIVFCEFQETVKEAYTLCLMQKPLVRPRLFLGQGAMTQKQQINVVDCFRKGTCNTLISTCIGEEGLDVGEVDLVVCFDISSKSPIRMIQRMGRTGRKREGKIIMLVSEGREHQSLQECLSTKNNMTSTILHSRELRAALHKESARMVPSHFEPTCTRMYITLPKVPQKLKNNNLKSMFSNMATFDDCSQEVVVLDSFEERIPRARFYFNKNDLTEATASELNTQNVVEHQRMLQADFGMVGASENSKLLVALLQMADSKRFNLPQGHAVPSSTKHEPTKKQSDIRSMFKPQQQQPSSQENPTTAILEENSIFCNTTLHNLNTELNDFLSIKSMEDYNCNICKHFFQCNAQTLKSDDFKVSAWTPLDFSILNSVNAESLQVFREGLIPKLGESFEELEDEFDDIMANFNEDEINTTKATIEENENESNMNINKIDDKVKLNENVIETLNSVNCNNLDDEMDFNDDVIYIEKKNCAFEFPKNAKKVIEMQADVELASQKQELEVDSIQGLLQLYQSTLKFFKLDSIDDMFSSPDDVDLDTTVINEFGFHSHNILETTKSEIVLNDNLTECSSTPVLCNSGRGMKRSQNQLFEEHSPDLSDNKRRRTADGCSSECDEAFTKLVCDSGIKTGFEIHKSNKSQQKFICNSEMNKNNISYSDSRSKLDTYSSACDEGYTKPVCDSGSNTGFTIHKNKELQQKFHHSSDLNEKNILYGDVNSTSTNDHNKTKLVYDSGNTKGFAIHKNKESQENFNHSSDINKKNILCGDINSNSKTCISNKIDNQYKKPNDKISNVKKLNYEDIFDDDFFVDMTQKVDNKVSTNKFNTSMNASGETPKVIQDFTNNPFEVLKHSDSQHTEYKGVKSDGLKNSDLHNKTPNIMRESTNRTFNSQHNLNNKLDVALRDSALQNTTPKVMTESTNRTFNVSMHKQHTASRSLDGKDSANQLIMNESKRSNKKLNSTYKVVDFIKERTPEHQKKKPSCIEQSPDLFDSKSSSSAQSKSSSSELLDVSSPNKAKRKLNLDDICDDSFLDFIMDGPKKTGERLQTNKSNKTSQDISNDQSYLSTERNVEKSRSVLLKNDSSCESSGGRNSQKKNSMCTENLSNKSETNSQKNISKTHQLHKQYSQDKMMSPSQNRSPITKSNLDGKLLKLKIDFQSNSKNSATDFLRKSSNSDILKTKSESNIQLYGNSPADNAKKSSSQNTINAIDDAVKLKQSPAKNCEKSSSQRRINSATDCDVQYLQIPAKHNDKSYSQIKSKTATDYNEQLDRTPAKNNDKMSSQMRSKSATDCDNTLDQQSTNPNKSFSQKITKNSTDHVVKLDKFKEKNTDMNLHQMRTKKHNQFKSVNIDSQNRFDKITDSPVKSHSESEISYSSKKTNLGSSQTKYPSTISTNKSKPTTSHNFTLNDICDMSLMDVFSKVEEVSKKAPPCKPDLGMSDIFDDDFLDCMPPVVDNKQKRPETAKLSLSDIMDESILDDCTSAKLSQQNKSDINRINPKKDGCTSAKQKKCNDIDRTMQKITSVQTKTTKSTKFSFEDIMDDSILDVFMDSKPNQKKDHKIDGLKLSQQKQFDEIDRMHETSKPTNISLADIIDESILEGCNDSEPSKQKKSSSDINRVEQKKYTETTKSSPDVLILKSHTDSKPSQQKKSIDIDSIMQKYLPKKIDATNNFVGQPISSRSTPKRTDTINKLTNTSKSKTGSQLMSKNSTPKIIKNRNEPTTSKSGSIHEVLRSSIETNPNESILIDDSDEDFDVSPVVAKKGSRPKITRPNGFIEREAERSGAETVSSDEDEGGTSQDMLETSFVDDESQMDTTNIRAHYLQSIRSPIRGRGTFKIPTLPRRIQPEIFSQMNQTTDNSYEYDSFCVDSESFGATQHDISELELAERMLEEKRRRRKAAAKPSGSRRRRILEVSSDSD